MRLQLLSFMLNVFGWAAVDDSLFTHRANEKMLYKFMKINCGLSPSQALSTKGQFENIMIYICTNNSFEGYDPHYYRNFFPSAKSVCVRYGNNSDGKGQKAVSATLYGTIHIWFVCYEIQDFNIKNGKFPTAPKSNEGLFARCPNLRRLNVQDTPLNKYWMEMVIKGIYPKELTMQNCNLYELPENFIDLSQTLIRLDLSHNHLRFVSFLFDLSKSTELENLEFLDLSYNDLKHDTSEMYAAVLMPRIQYLIVDHNSRFDICNYLIAIKPKDQGLVVLSELRVVSASFTRTSRLCFDTMKTENLIVVNISYSMVSTLSELPAIAAPNFTMDLQGNNIINIKSFGINEYDALKWRFAGRNNIKATVLANVKQLQCDCDYSWLQKALKDNSNLKVQDILCSDGIELIHQEWNRLNCTKFDCADCICRKYANSTSAQCSSGTTHTIPEVDDLSHLYAASNRIESLNVSLFKDTLVLVDLRANRISRLDLETIRAMFSKPDRYFRLAGNPIICDCTNQVLLANLRSHRHQVMDYNELTCAGGEMSLIDVKEDQICDSEQLISGTPILVIALATTCIVVIILALITFIYYCYGRQIKVFLYARGWFLCFIRENDINENRPYDVFISFAHEDEEFIASELLPGLETGTTTYKTCIHLRDWTPGEMIPTQIVKSVETSRRTLVVVSKCFVKSLWGLMEFRTAHASAMTEKRNRIILVLLDDVCEDDVLDPELKWYMRTNTYLRWGDPWFWDKLRYALPHKLGT